MKEVQVIFGSVLLFLSGIILCISQSFDGDLTVGLQKLKTVADSIGKAHVAAGSTVGLSIAIGVDGEMIYQEVLESRTCRRTSMPLLRLYIIGSIAKQFTAAAVLKLAEQEG